MHNTEDKTFWVEDGRKREDVFVESIAPKLGINAQINPAKKYNKYAPDLIVDDSLADLKSQTTPFYTSPNPNEYVTFNEKDYIRYKEQYPDIIIYFHVNWPDSTAYGKSVTSKNGVWRISFQDIDNAVAGGRVRLHGYQRRVNDTRGNAKTSYLLSLSIMEHIGNIT